MDDATLTDVTVLVVEDQVMVAQYLVQTLRAAGARVSGPARNPSEARWLRQIESPKLAVLDIMLGDDGVQSLADQLSKEGVPFCFFTGLGHVDHIAASYPGVPIISKLDPEALVPALASLLTSGEGAAKPGAPVPENGAGPVRADDTPAA